VTLLVGAALAYGELLNTQERGPYIRQLVSHWYFNVYLFIYVISHFDFSNFCTCKQSCTSGMGVAYYS